MIHYKPYHYHLIFAVLHLLVVGACIYFLTLPQSWRAVSYLAIGWSSACLYWSLEHFVRERRSWRSVERIMNYAKGGEEL